MSKNIEKNIDFKLFHQEYKKVGEPKNRSDSSTAETEVLKLLFLFSVEGGNFSLMRRLLSSCQGLLVAAVDKQGQTSLHIASYKGYEKIVQFLLDNNVNVNSRDYMGRTPLHLASSSGSEIVVQLLLNNGAKVSSRDHQKRHSLHFAAECGHLEVIEILLKAKQIGRKSVDVNVFSLEKETPLHLAALMGHTHLVKYLVRRGAYVDVRKNDRGSPLHLAVAAGHVETVKELIKYRATVSGTAQGYCKITIGTLHCAILEQSYIKKTTSLIEQERTTLDELQIQKQAQIVDILLKAGAKFPDDEATETAENNLLHIAVKKNHVVLMKKLLDLGMKVDACTFDENYTPLHMAALYGSPKIVKILLNAGADVNFTSLEGLQPIHYAIISKNYKILSMLICAGADINSKTSLQKTIIDYFHSHEPLNFPFFYTILECGVNINSQNKGNSGLHILSPLFNRECCVILFDQFLDFNVVNFRNETPLQSAITRGLPIENIHFIIKAMAKLEGDNKLKINEENMSILCNKFNDLYQNCKAELEALKKQKVWGQISYFELLHKSLKKLRGYARNSELMKVLDSGACKLFLIYGGVIESRMRFALKLSEIHNKSIITLNRLMHPVELSLHVADKILNFLNFDDSEKLSIMY